MAHEYKLTVAWGDTDAAGIVFFVNFYNWMDDAMNEMFSSLGIPPSILFKEDKIGLPILESHCEYKSPVFFGDKVSVLTKVTEVRDKVFRVDHSIYRDETLLAKGYIVRAWCSLASEKMKAVSIPENVRELMLECASIELT